MISTHFDGQELVESPTRFQAILSSDDVTRSSLRHGRDSNSEPQGVQAGNEIPAGVTVSLGATEVILGQDLLTNSQDHRATPASDCVRVYFRNGRLECSNKCDTEVFWIQLIQSARDRHEQNVELLRGPAGLCLFTMRPIGRGEQLLIWYGEGLAIEAGVPVLTPCNIRGHQEYVCTGCHARFSFPNVLKAHMVLQCTKKPSSVSMTTEPLTPFHQILQTICKTPTDSTAKVEQARHMMYKSKDPRLSSVASSCPRQGCMDCRGRKAEVSYKSAFKAPSTSRRETKREAGSDDGLMTPDSSTDQSSALNLSVKPAEASTAMDEVSEMQHQASHAWNSYTAQQMMAQPISIPLDYAHLAGCYQAAPHLHALGIQLMNCGQPPLQQGHGYGSPLDRAVCSNADFSLIAPQMEDVHERVAVSLSSFKLHGPSSSPSVRQIRPSNPYGFELPSDKEPLDLLPQAYFANKSKKGHLCLCCGKLYSRKYGLKIHMRTHNGYKPLKCKICSRPFGDPSNLNKHVRLHAQGETPYRCEFCGKVLVRRRDLERHVRSRHPVGGAPNDEPLGLCESSPDSSPVSIESSENTLAPKEPA